VIQGAGPPSGEQSPESRLEGVRILVVDDDFRNIFAMTAMLERSQAVVIAAESGAAAIATLDDQHHAIDIVLMDIMMPIMDGYETIRALRTRDHLQDIPIIAVTGRVIPGERGRCLDAGANDYIPKPVEVVDLFLALTPWLPARASSAA
jgi:CheY-like chemotaxis protein